MTQRGLPPAEKAPVSDLRSRRGWSWPFASSSMKPWRLGGASTDLNGAVFWLAVGTYLTAMQLPLGGLLFYPISFLGAWAHEFGHCVASEMLSGICLRIELLPSFGGTAYHRTPGGDGPRALVSAAGLLGPSVVGGFMLLLARRFGMAGVSLFGVSAGLFYTAAYWAQDPFTIITCVVGGISFGVLGAMPFALLRSLIAQFVAIAFAVEAVAKKDYAFVESFQRDGEKQLSDTGNIAARLGGSYEFWAVIVMAFVILILVASYLASRRSDEL